MKWPGCVDYPGGQQSAISDYGVVGSHDISTRITMSGDAQVLAWLRSARLFTASRSDAFLDRCQLCCYARTVAWLCAHQLSLFSNWRFDVPLITSIQLSYLLEQHKKKRHFSAPTLA